MNTREIAVEYRLSHWAEIIKERNERGLTVKAYCERLGMACYDLYGGKTQSFATFSYKDYFCVIRKYRQALE